MKDNSRLQGHNRFLKGLYKIQNPRKILCKRKDTCIYRSSWEKTLMVHLDTNDAIKGWCSECVMIPYYFNGKPHRYYPDFLVMDNEGNTKLIEVKPHRQTIPPRKSKKKSKKTNLYEQVTYHKNLAKWEAAKKFCKKRGWEFKIVTEKHMRI